LPSAPPDGTQYTFKDHNYTFSNSGSGNHLSLTSAGSDLIENGPSVINTTLTYTKPNLGFTLQYFATDLTWRIISKTDNEMNPLLLDYANTPFTVIDPRQEDYYIDTGSVTGNFIFNTYEYSGASLIDGMEFSLKDNSGSWLAQNVIIQTSENIEYPTGTISAGTTTLSTNYKYVKWRYDAQTTTWFLIS